MLAAELADSEAQPEAERVSVATPEAVAAPGDLLERYEALATLLTDGSGVDVTQALPEVLAVADALAKAVCVAPLALAPLLELLLAAGADGDTTAEREAAPLADEVPLVQWLPLDDAVPEAPELGDPAPLPDVDLVPAALGDTTPLPEELRDSAGERDTLALDVALRLSAGDKDAARERAAVYDTAPLIVGAPLALAEADENADDDIARDPTAL